MTAPTETPEVDGQGAYLSRECPATGCAGVGPFYRVVCTRCFARGCDECIVQDDDGLAYTCDDCRSADAHRRAPTDACCEAEGWPS